MKTRTIMTVALLIAAIGTALPIAPTARAATTITFWARNSEASFVQTLVTDYNASHATQVKLTIIPAAQFVTKFGIASAAGTVPDVAAIDLVFLPSFAAANQLTDVTARAHGLPFLKQLSPSHMRLATYKGKIYAMPFTAEGSILLYNKALFRRANLNPNAPPTTWGQIEADAKKITALGGGIHGFYFPGVCPGCEGFTFLPLVWASGGDVLNADGTKATMTSPVLKDALTFYRRLWLEGLVSRGAQVDNGATWFSGFQAGKDGMVAGGAFEINTLKTLYPKIDFGVTYLPGKTGGWSSFAGGDEIAIPRGSAHAAEAWSFITWALSPKAQTDYLAKNGIVPVRTDLAVNRYSKLDPRYVITANAMAHGRTLYSVHDNQLFNDANSPWNVAFQQAVFGGHIDQALATAQGRFTQILSSQ